jgi:glycosyltransferase involved in cell wall biosynthesis
MNFLFGNIILYVLIFLLPFHMQAEEQKSRSTICLNMIVKNETKVIERCLASMLPVIDYWVIVDTGSTDGTQQVINDFMKSKGVPGDLYERPWVNFGHNRNEALQLARSKADYVIFIDADDYFVYDAGFKLPHLDKDYYYAPLSRGGTKYSRIQLVNNHLDWEWVGELHELIIPPPSRSYGSLEKVVTMSTTEGARSQDPQKYQKDAQLLEAALKKNPSNTRNVFYLAQSYRAAGDYSSALKNYEKRAGIGGWDEEVFWSLLEIGRMKDCLEMPADDVIECYSRAYEYRKSRIEPLYYIANYYRETKNYHLGYLAAKLANSFPVSKDILFVQQWMYDYGVPIELSVCAYWLGKYEECKQISVELLLKKDKLPPDVRTLVEKNLAFANEKLLEQNNQKDSPQTTSSK